LSKAIGNGYPLAGQTIRDGIAGQALDAGLTVSQTGRPQMPWLSFAADQNFAIARAFCAAVDHGVILHPRHNWFVCAAHTDKDVERVLEATAAGLDAVSRQSGRG
jgi:glutamate-1-semialdehyde 2,1-aminomutase